jgi:hypothetical protein
VRLEPRTLRNLRTLTAARDGRLTPPTRSHRHGATHTRARVHGSESGRVDAARWASMPTPPPAPRRVDHLAHARDLIIGHRRQRRHRRTHPRPFLLAQIPHAAAPPPNASSDRRPTGDPREGTGRTARGGPAAAGPTITARRTCRTPPTHRPGARRPARRPSSPRPTNIASATSATSGATTTGRANGPSGTETPVTATRLTDPMPTTPPNPPNTHQLIITSDRLPSSPGPPDLCPPEQYLRTPTQYIQDHPERNRSLWRVRRARAEVVE